TSRRAKSTSAGPGRCYRSAPPPSPRPATVEASRADAHLRSTIRDPRICTKHVSLRLIDRLSSLPGHIACNIHGWAHCGPPKGVVTMRRAIKALVLTAAVVGVCAPTQARADGYVSPWAGVNFGYNNEVSQVRISTCATANCGNSFSWGVD